MKKKSSMIGNMLNAGITTMVGAGMIGATADVAAGLPSGMAKDMAGTAVGLQSVALLGPNIKLVKSSLPSSKKKGKFSVL